MIQVAFSSNFKKSYKKLMKGSENLEPLFFENIGSHDNVY